MTVSPGVARPRPGPGTRETALLLLLSAGAWAVTVALARGMAGMAGTMGLGLVAFVAVWTLMMAAMMLPSVTPAARLYARTVSSPRGARIAGPGSMFLLAQPQPGLMRQAHRG